jgi:NADH-quinone oxidoreductase subunit M
LAYLNALIFLPVVGAIIIALTPGLSERAIKRLAAVVTFIPLALSIYLFAIFDRTQGLTGVMQFETNVSWIPAINAFYHVGGGRPSLPLVLLMAVLGFLVVLISWKVHLRVREYFAWLLLLETAILGVICFPGYAAVLPVLGIEIVPCIS